MLTHASYVCRIFQTDKNLRYLQANQEELAKGIETHLVLPDMLLFK